MLVLTEFFLELLKGIRGGICHAAHRYAETNKKYRKNYDKMKESSYTQYLDANSLYGWAMSQKLSVVGLEWEEDTLIINKKLKKFKKLIKNYDEGSDEGFTLEVDIKYPKNLHDLHNGLPFLPESIKINKCSKLASNLYDRKSYVV